MSRDYHLMRAKRERALGDAWTDPIARRIHLELARLHEERANAIEMKPGGNGFGDLIAETAQRPRAAQ